jgi:putative YjhG/YagF family dehydratase
MLVQDAAKEFQAMGTIPFSVYCSDPCDGRIQGTPGMHDSLAFRNDAAGIFRRLIRCAPTRKGVLGIATCDKGLPAVMMALASMRDLPCVLVPGGVTLPPTHGEDLGKIQSIGARVARDQVSLEYAQQMSCSACASPGGGCHFLGTAATSQVIGEALGLTLPHAALSPSGEPIWHDMARRSAHALVHMESKGLTTSDILSNESIQNAMTVFSAFGGSTNLLLHLPAIAHAAGLDRPTVQDWIKINRKTPRLVDVLPNGPIGHPTVRVFMAGGVPEVMLHLRDLGLLNPEVLTITGEPLSKILDWWQTSERRQKLQDILKKQDGINPDQVIMNPEQAHKTGIMPTCTFPGGNLAPEGSVIKSTAIDPQVVDHDGVYRHTGPARVFTSEHAAIQAVKKASIKPGDIMILCCVGPLGSGMEETFQVTAALKHLSWGKHVALITDGRFSGVSTGACIGHVGPEALAGGPIGKLLDGDMIEIIIDRNKLEGHINLIGDANSVQEERSTKKGTRLLAKRQSRPDLKPHPELPQETRLWATLQNISGGTWGGCVYDIDQVIRTTTNKGFSVTT